MDRAAAFEAEGRGFESLQARHLSSQLSAVSYQSLFPTYDLHHTTYDIPPTSFVFTNIPAFNA